MKVLEKMPVQFKCNCSKAHFGAIMASLGQSELQQMIDEDGGAEAVCKFCGNKYQYSVADLQALMGQAEK
ncbi:chaperonin [Agrilactobacillus composti DSM 18527 = JCM 14202]|nr:chaperonin [Agrilactobacillus composti DSM 18527 = JCM 14202]